MSDSAPPGWYPDGRGGQRYWDGGRWLDAPPPGPPPSGPPPSGPPPSGPPPGAGPRSWADAAYTPPPGPPRRSRTPLWVALGVAAIVVVAALVTTLVLTSGGDGSDTSDDQADPGPTSQTDSGESDEPTEDPQPTEEPRGDPADTVQAFIDAALDGDCDALEDLVTDDFLDESGDCSDDDFDGSTLKGIELEVGDTEVDGDTATVGLVSSYQGQSEEIDLQLVYEDDAWLIDGTDALDPPSVSDAPVQPSPS